MQILLVRHGATDWNLQGRCQGSTDMALNEVGLQQAVEMAASLRSEVITALYSSNLTRALQTAELIGRARNLPVVIEERFRELNHGALEGLTFSEIHEQYPEFIRKWKAEPAELLIPGGERLVDVDKRAWDGMDQITGRHGADETVLVVTHNFPILAILCRISNRSLNQYRTFRLDPCSLSRVSYDTSDGWRIVQPNDRG
ncbi:MAG: histidine phosphatase family protein [Deltaproteobacteria bacterium]|nr:histidine phosphatase family protein [Deltaproteobacteria bacterium]